MPTEVPDAQLPARRRTRCLTPEEAAWLRGEDVPAGAGNPSLRPDAAEPGRSPGPGTGGATVAGTSPGAGGGRRVGRRGLLFGSLGVVGVAATARALPTLGSSATGGSPLAVGPAPDDGEPHARCVDPASLLATGRIGPARLAYEVDGRPRPMRFDAAFHTQLVRWLADWNAHSGLPAVTGIGSYGAHVAKDACHSWHAAGRAFDIARLTSGDRLLASCRHDLWPQLEPARRAALDRRYWALAASLHLHFAYVLTHHFDDAHQNHIHVDNGISGAGMSHFDPASRVQNQAVQAICATLWRQDGPVTGEWSDARRQVAPVLDRLGRYDLTRQATWQAFLRASMARG